MDKRWFILGGAGILITWGLYQSNSMDAFVKSTQNKETIAFQNVHDFQPLQEPVQEPAKAPSKEQSGHIQHEGTTSSQAVISHAIAENNAKLLERITDEAKSRSIPPIDAKLDRIWKAIPGLNGREVDIEETWRQAIQLSHSGAASFPLIYKTIPPAVTLEHLGAQPIYKGNPNKPMVSLMINVAWGNEFLPIMLDVLDRQKVKATFFFDGSWLSKNEAVAKNIGEKGHELSNHAYSHKNMSQLGREQAIEEIEKTQKLVEKLGANNKLFAPPSGDFNEQTVKIARELGLHTILWTLDTVDWKNPGGESIIRRLTPRLEPGAMILMHPTSSSSDALEQLIVNIKEKGFVLGTVSELISPERVHVVEQQIKF